MRFPHIGIKIFEELDNQNVTLCRTVTTSWKSFIDGKKFFWIRKLERYISISKEDIKDLWKSEIGSTNPIQNDLMTVLHEASVKGDSSIFHCLLPIIIDKNPKDRLGITPLHLAADYGHLDICETIIGWEKKQEPKDYLWNNSIALGF